jgi:ATP-binding cassette subfamily F protein 3
MSLITAKNLSKLFGPDEIFRNVSVDVPQGARIALVGPNGAGKTTLLNILIGDDVPNEGTVQRARNTQIGFLPQRPELRGEITLWDEVLGAFDDLRAMEAELNTLEHDLTDPDKHDAALAIYGDLQQRFDHAGGYTYDQRMRFVLHGLGFEPDDYHKPLSQLSGGQKTRAMLARLLLEAPDLLALDEPTNHLDIAAIEWLESYLKGFPGAVLAVSHDRYFMDAVATVVWEMDFGTLERYRGNYSHYVRQREDRHERLLKEFEAQQEFIAKEEEYIRRHMGSQNTNQAKGRLKRLDRLKRDKLALRPRQRKHMHLNIAASGRSGDKVLETFDLAVGYDDAPEPLFTAPDILLLRGEVAALIGPNGAGKTTFLKTILDQLDPLSGTTKIGAAVEIGYFAQAHEALIESNSVIDELLTVQQMPISEARNYLGKFMFSGDDVFRPVATLSGGERGRIALAKLALGGANFLLLDEPTNHLDIDSQEILQNVLADFPGTILIVSHDRYLIGALATQIWAVKPGELTVYKGPYREFIAARDTQSETVASSNGAEAKQPTRQPTTTANSNSKPAHGLNPFQLKKRLDELETEIHDLEARLESITAALESASMDGNAQAVSDLGEEYNQTEARLNAIMEAWALLAE